MSFDEKGSRDLAGEFVVVVIEMSVRQQKSGDDGSSVVVVAVKAAKEISRTALVWALTNVVKPGDCVRLLVVIPTQLSSNILLFLF